MSSPNLPASIASYDINLLMSQTRELAADYRQQTGHALPVTEELARFDAINILGLHKSDKNDGIDATDSIKTNPSDEVTDKQKMVNSYLIKGRVIFKGGKARQKLGKLSLQAKWSNLLMVIYNAEYLPTQIYSIKRDVIDKEMENLMPDKRGSMTVAKYKAIGVQVWENSDLVTTQISQKSAQNNPIKSKNGPGNSVDNGQSKIENN